MMGYITNVSIIVSDSYADLLKKLSPLVVLKKQAAGGGADGGLLELKAAPLGTELGQWLVTGLSVNKHLVPVLKGEAHDSKHRA